MREKTCDRELDPEAGSVEDGTAEEAEGKVLVELIVALEGELGDAIEEELRDLEHERLVAVGQDDCIELGGAVGVGTPTVLFTMSTFDSGGVKGCIELSSVLSQGPLISLAVF